MKKPLLLLLFSAFCFIPVFSKAQIQNLVPNASFEQMDSCSIAYKDYNGSLNVSGSVSRWFGGLIPQTSGSATAYLNPCADGHACLCGTPNNDQGYQSARTGVAYAFLYSGMYYHLSEYERGYLNVKLNKNTVIGHKYCVTFFVNHTDSSYYASKNMGMLFTTYADTIHSSIPSPPILPIFAHPQIVNTNFITDKVNWVPVQGIFTADSAYSYICIGDFSKDTSFLKLTGGYKYQAFYLTSAYFIDDVSVIEMPHNAGANTTVCAGDSVQIGTAPEANFNYKWFPEAGLCLRDTAISNPYVKPTQTTTYYLTVQDSAGCSSTDSVIVTVYCDNTLQIPNVITPNYDGKNDAFYIQNLPTQSTLTIFNRWGKTVYHSLNYQNNWEADGLNGGTYYYLLTLPDGTVKKGFLEVIK